VAETERQWRNFARRREWRPDGQVRDCPAEVGTLTRGCARSVEADFDSLRQYIPADEPSVFLFCLDHTVASKQWILVSWSPDNSQVRLKMLYASSREDIKRNLGPNYFVGEYYANSVDDIAWSGYQVLVGS
jgi:hypothetical protein